MAVRSLIGVFVFVCGLLAAGCGKEPAKQTQNSAATATESTAWWKTEPEPGMQKAGTTLSGESLPEWNKVDASLASKGKEIFNKECASCHTFGKGAAAGPDLQGVTHRDTPQWTAKFISAPETMVKNDPHGKELMNKYLVQMPNMQLKPDEVQSLNAFFHQQDDAALHGNKK